MAKDIKHKVLTDEDIKIIQSDPVGLADYVVRTKVKEAKKTAIIFTIVLAVCGFVGGVVTGMAWIKTSIPNNVVQIQVGDNASETTVEQAEAKK